MTQYIKKSDIVAEIEKKKIPFKKDIEDGVYPTYLCALMDFEDFINTLEAKEDVVSTAPLSPNSLKINRDGNSHIEAMTEALRTEYEKGRADVLRCIDPDVMVADFCSQPLSKTRSLASIYRQGIIDVLKRINNNEKTSITSTRSIDDGGVHRA